MALGDILGAVTELGDARETLTRTLRLMSNSARDYALTALHKSDEAMSIAMEGGVCAQVFGLYITATTNNEKARTALQNAHDLTEILESMGQCDDDEANLHYADQLSDIIPTCEIDALIVGVETRLEFVASALPEDPVPGARLNAHVYEVSTSKPDDYA